MTDIEQKALALVNEIFAEVGGSPIDYDALVGAGDVVTLALCHAIEQHEAYKQEVSDAVANWKDMSDFSSFETMLKLAEQDLFGFIIPTPKPDPLVEALDSLGLRKADEWAGDIRKALAARGLEIGEKGQ